MLNWQKVVLSCVTLAVAGALVWHHDLTWEHFAALAVGVSLPGPWSLMAPKTDPDKTVAP